MPSKISKTKQRTSIKVIGLGGAGCNAVHRMMNCKLLGVELIAANTDIQDLNKTKAHVKIRLGRNITRGLGAGMNPKIGEAAAKESQQDLEGIIGGADMLFITAGLGGGTGTGAAPVVAEIAKKLGILTVAIVTEPFSFEGAERNRLAKDGVAELKSRVDTLLTINNDKIFEICERATPIRQAFWAADDLLRQAVQGISDLIAAPGFINVDFADIKSVMKHGGQAMFGVGRAIGENRAERAAQDAISSPFLNFSIDGSKGVLFNIACAEDIGLAEIEDAASIITKKVDSRAKVIFGAVKDQKLKKGELKVTVIATGLSAGR